MKRFLLDKLLLWKDRPTRRPLILRGARQVGKTHLVREFARTSFEHLLEVNFEESASLASLFRSKDPDVICELLASRYSVPVVDGRTLLFLDELQAAEPYVFESLRYFKEKRPGLHVVAAGSLLEFMLEGPDREKKKNFPMPVGRVEYMFVPPMDFEEFLVASGRTGLVDWLRNYRIGDMAPAEIHGALSHELRRYLAVGGMPAAVDAFLSGDILEAERTLETILATYRDDFPKYAGRVPAARLRKVFDAIPALLGEKLVYERIDRGEKSRDLSAAFGALRLARVVAKVRQTPANGIPLGFGADDGAFKPLFLDVGLASRSLGLKLVDYVEDGDALLQNQGGICEQFVGQHLLYAGEEFEEPAAYCWRREARNASAEVDYIVADGRTPVPVEVKAGTTGAMKGLHVFLAEKKRHFAVRLNADVPSFLPDVRVKDVLGRPVEFSLLSLPLYFVRQLPRLVREVRASAPVRPVRPRESD